MFCFETISIIPPPLLKALLEFIFFEKHTKSVRCGKPENIYVMSTSKYLFNAYCLLATLNANRWPVMKIMRAISKTCWTGPDHAHSTIRFIKRPRLVKIFTIRATYQSPIVLPSFNHVSIQGQSKTSPYGINLSALTCESNICIFRLQLLLPIV